MCRQKTNFVVDNGPEGSCNICGEFRKLSQEHIPPRGGLKTKNVRIIRALDVIGSKFAPSQIAELPTEEVVYRTTCGRCNNRMAPHDQALNELQRDMRERYFLRSKWCIVPPKQIEVRTRPYAVIRSVLGHVIAARRDMGSIHLKGITKEVLFDPNGNIPDNIRIFYWFHAYDTIVLQADMMMILRPGDINSCHSFSLMKYHPIAFLVSDDCDKLLHLPDMCQYRKAKRKDWIEISVKVDDTAPLGWPEKHVMHLGGLSIEGWMSGR